jgi:hypothetical protein
MAKRMRRTPERTKRTIMGALFQAYKAFPKLIAMTRQRIEAIERVAPRKSKFLLRATREVDGDGSKAGRRKM